MTKKDWLVATVLLTMAVTFVVISVIKLVPIEEKTIVQKIGNVNGPGVNVEIFELSRKNYNCIFAVQNQVTMFQCVR